MNRQGQTFMIAIIFAVFIYLFGIVFINFLIPDVDTSRTALNCSDGANISGGTRLMCLFVNSVVVYWIWLIISLAAGMVLEKLVL